MNKLKDVSSLNMTLSRSYLCSIQSSGDRVHGDTVYPVVLIQCPHADKWWRQSTQLYSVPCGTHPLSSTVQ